SETARSTGSSSDTEARPAGSPTVHDPEATTATAGEPRASDAHAPAQAQRLAPSEPTAGPPTASEPADAESTDDQATDTAAMDVEPREYAIASSERPTSRIRLSSMPPELVGEAASEPSARGVASSERPTSRIRLSSAALAAAERLASKVLTPEPPAAGP